jgi:CoA transferase family III
VTTSPIPWPNGCLDLTPFLLAAPVGGEVPTGDPAERWAASGGMWLTGRADGPGLAVTRAVPSTLDQLASRLRRTTAAFGRTVDVDGPALLGERAAIAGHERSGDTSCGGATRLLRSADGWVSVTLPRAADVELLPAWLGVDPISAEEDPWPAVAGAVAVRTAGHVVATGAELGLPVALLGERACDRAAVLATRLADAPPCAALQSRRVVDLSSLWAGPLCAQLLAAAGMEVVKVESLQRPDGARRGPAAFFDLMNGDKASVALDLSAAEDRRVLRRLMMAADVVIEASRPRAMRQLGYDAGELVRMGRARVWLSITGHGREPPHDHRVAFGDDGAVAGGLVAYDDRGPVFCADAAADPITGLLAAVAVVDRLAAGGRWLLDLALARSAALLATGPTLAWTGPVAPPRARTATRRASRLGADTDRVVAALPP